MSLFKLSNRSFIFCLGLIVMLSGLSGCNSPTSSKKGTVAEPNPDPANTQVSVQRTSSQLTKLPAPSKTSPVAKGANPNKVDKKVEDDKILGREVMAGELFVTLYQGVKRKDLEKAVQGMPYKVTIDSQLGDTQSFLLKVPVKSVHECRFRLENHPYIAVCELNFVESQNRFNDPVLRPSDERDWNIKRIKAPEAWEFTTGGAAIAIVDTGVKINHEEFDGKLRQAFSVFTNSKTMHTGLVTLATKNGPVQSYITKHGTHVAGTAAGLANNNKGTCGIAPASPIVPIQAMSYFPHLQRITASAHQLVSAIDKAIDSGAKVINYSIGGPPPPHLLNPWLSAPTATAKEAARQQIVEQFVKPNINYFKAVLDKADRNKVIFVKAAGNNNLPAEFDYLSHSGRVISVAATNQKDGRAIFDNQGGESNYGSYTTVSAPGQNIWNAVSGPGQPYDALQGTSMAAPHVAGVVALMKSIDPELTAKEAAEILVQTGRKLNTDKPIGPLVNAEAAIVELQRRRTNKVPRPRQDPPLIPAPPTNPCDPKLPDDGLDICKGPRPWTNFHVRRLIDLWLCIAIPVVRDMDRDAGPYFCDRYGRVVNMKILVTLRRPAYAATRYQWLWENARTLQSSNYGSMYAFIIEMMKSGEFKPTPKKMDPKVFNAEPKKANVIRTMEYHQLTNLKGHIYNHEGAHFGFDGKTVVFGFKPHDKKEGEVWSMPFGGGQAELLERYPADFKGPGWAVSGMVDISSQGPRYAIHSNGAGYLRYIPLDANGRKSGSPKTIFKANGKANVQNLKARKVPYVLLSGDGERLDTGTKEKILAGIHSIDANGNSKAILTNKMIADQMGCKPHDIQITTGGRFHFDASQDGRVIAVVHVMPSDKKKWESLFGCYLFVGGPGLNPKIIAKKQGKDARYYYSRVAISGNGQKVAFSSYNGGQATVANFDGSSQKVILRKEDKIGFPDSVSPFQLSHDGEYLLNGAEGVVLKTDGSSRYGLGNTPRSYSMLGWTLPKVLMGPEPGKFIFLRGLKSGHQLCSVEVNPANLKSSTPMISKFELEPMALPAHGGKHTIARAWVPADPKTLRGVRTMCLKDGILDKTMYFPNTVDNGDKRFGDVKGDRIYTDVRWPLAKDATGSRTIRMDVESVDGNGMHHGYAIEFGPVEIRKIEKDPSLVSNGIEIKN